MKEKIKHLVRDAATRAFAAGSLPSAEFPDFEIEIPRLATHGDFSANIAMVGAKIQKQAPRKIAETLLGYLTDSDGILEKTEIAGPGFINFYLKPSAWIPLLHTVLDRAEAWGRVDIGQGTKIQVEFVSANPTGPLHVGHGRGAAVGDTLARILSSCGYNVQKEYYINDSGRQIRTLGLSVWLRFKELSGKKTAFPEDCYQGDYIRDLAKDAATLFPELRMANDEEGIAICAPFAAERILDGIRQDLENFGVVHDVWFSEQSLYDSGNVDAALKALEKTGHVYEKDGAKWFRTTDYGDEKDRVVIRNNGITTYFASDIAYHKNKFERGFDRVVDVWGADHHGYIKRIKAAVAATGTDPERFEVSLVQFVTLLRNGEPVSMSTRSGEFETLRSVLDEVGRDAARFFFLMRSHETSLDFDLELAKKKNNENPVFYVQYVHARIASILRKAEEIEVRTGTSLELLTEKEEITLIKEMAKFPEVVALSGKNLEPHRIIFYLMELAASFHSYYNMHKVLGENRELSAARLSLVQAVQQVIFNGLSLLGVSAPEEM